LAKSSIPPFFLAISADSSVKITAKILLRLPPPTLPNPFLTCANYTNILAQIFDKRVTKM
jgi:hypothetical protein